MSLQSAGGGDYSTLVINTLINRTQNIIYADSSPTTTFQGSVSIPSLRITDSVTNSPNPLSFVGDVNINGVLGNDKNLKGLIVGNRDFTKCDANGDGLPGTDPNANQVTNTIWGPSTFHTAVTIDKRQNPADAFNVFGLGLEVKNTSATPYPSIFGAPQGALTAFNLGHDGSNAGAEFNQTFFYYGPGHFRNKISMDSSDNIFATTPALTITMPTRSLISSLSVMTGNYITTSGNVGTVKRINAFKDQFGAGTPVPGMTLTISAEPAELNVTNAIIISVIPKAGSTTNEFDLTYEFNAGGTYTSTKINYVYIGPGVYGLGNTGTVVFPKGPKPLVGQHISILAQPTSLNASNTTILTVTEGTTTSSLTYALTSPLATLTNAVAITSVKLLPGTVGLNSNYGGQGNLGIHTLTPKASLDVTGDVIFREVTTNNPMLQITTIPHPGAASECTMTIANPFDTIQPSVFVEYDLTNQLIKYKNSVTDTTMYQVNAATGYQTYYNPDGTKVIDIACLQAPSAFTFYKTGGTDVLFKVDQDTKTVTIAPDATFNYPVSSIIQTKNFRVDTNAGLPTFTIYNGDIQHFSANGINMYMSMSQATSTIKHFDNLIQYQKDNKSWMEIDGTVAQMRFRATTSEVQYLNIDSATKWISYYASGVRWKTDDCTNSKTLWRKSDGTTIMEIATTTAPNLSFYKTGTTTKMFNIDQATNTITIDPSVTFVAPGVVPQSPAYMTLVKLNYLIVPIAGTTPMGGNFLGIDTLTDRGSTSGGTNIVQNTVCGIQYNGPQNRFELINSASLGCYRVSGFVEMGISGDYYSELQLVLGASNTILYKARQWPRYNWPEYQNVSGGTFDYTVTYQIDWVVKLDATNPYFKIQFKSVDPAETSVFYDARLTFAFVK